MDATQLMDAVQVEHDVCYHPAGAAHACRSHYLDVYAPHRSDAGAKLPVVLFLHGGGWRRGDRRSRVGFHQNVGQALAQHGVVAVLPSYRKSLTWAPWMIGLFGASAGAGLAMALALLQGADIRRMSSAAAATACSLYGAFAYGLRQLIRAAGWGVRHSSHTEDCAMALDWAAAGGVERFGGDCRKLVLMGQSAGAHMAALLALPTTPFLQRDVKTHHVKGLIAISGIYSGPLFRRNLLHRILYSYIFEGASDFDSCFALGHCPHGHDAGGENALSEVQEALSSPLEKMCPVLLINAAVDVGLRSHAIDFATALRKGRVHVDGPHVIPGTDHFTMMPSIGRKGVADREVMPRIMEFVASVCQRVC
eukprot:TRINITY_DN79329_c0_g1_i1.p1 TRINITY_DN79329_c0_g1~~TRINITY_DN79329_c0_g1_i1.p1  ORF type:complete len:365 (-),score=56.88 TRINITY_DN79329_c0_g1_i1:34-1128(-)